MELLKTLRDELDELHDKISALTSWVAFDFSEEIQKILRDAMENKEQYARDA